MLISVVYKDRRHDLVKGFILDQLLEAGELKKFYRHSEKKWVVVGTDPVRGMGGKNSGFRRRQSDAALTNYIEL